MSLVCWLDTSANISCLLAEALPRNPCQLNCAVCQKVKMAIKKRHTFSSMSRIVILLEKP